MPPSADVVVSGPDGRDLPVPRIPLPLEQANETEPPGKVALGEGLYAYLRQFPDCPYNRAYAELLQRGFPHYLSDLAAQAVLLEHKTVDSPYLLRQLNCLKILALLQPEKAELQFQLGVASYRLALMFQELEHSHQHLLSALGHFNKSVKEQAENPAALNYLAHVNFLIGDYPVALLRWQQAIEFVADETLKEAMQKRVDQLQGWDVPEYPLLDDLEQLSLALQAHDCSNYAEALQILAAVEERGFLLREFSFPEFYYLSGLCRLNLQDLAGARDGYLKALQIDADFEPASAELAKLEKRGET